MLRPHRPCGPGRVCYRWTWLVSRLASCYPAVSGAEARSTIDAGGLAVAPGFIAAHTHSDLPSLLAPLAESRLYAGVTTEICGNCGYAAGPYRDADREHFLEHYEGLEITWRTQAEFFSRLEDAGSAVNRAFLVGHGNVRRTAMGGDLARPATAAELKSMRKLARAEIDAGAIGMATGLLYPPGCFADQEGSRDAEEQVFAAFAEDDAEVRSGFHIGALHSPHQSTLRPVFAEGGYHVE